MFSVLFGDVRVDVYPKYPEATKDRPVTLNVTVAFDLEDLEIQESLGYGLPVTMSDRMISSLAIDAPSGLGGSFRGIELILSPIDTQLHEPITIVLDIMDGENLVASWPVHLDERTVGPKGLIVSGTDSTGWLEVQLRVNLDDKEIESQFRVRSQACDAICFASTCPVA